MTDLWTRWFGRPGHPEDRQLRRDAQPLVDRAVARVDSRRRAILAQRQREQRQQAVERGGYD